MKLLKKILQNQKNEIVNEVAINKASVLKSGIISLGILAYLAIVIFSCSITQRCFASAQSSNASDIEFLHKANNIMNEFTGIVLCFFDRDNNEGLDSHIGKFNGILSKFDALRSGLQAQFSSNKSVKLGVFLETVTEIQNSFTAIYGAMCTRQSKNVTDAFKKNASKPILKKIMNKLGHARQYLTENESHVLDSIINSANRLVDTLPSDIGCAAMIIKRCKS